MKCYLVKGKFTSESKSPWIYTSLHNLMSLKYQTISIYDADMMSVINQIDAADIVFFADSYFLNFNKDEVEKLLSDIPGYKILISFDDEYMIDWTLYFSKYVNLIITFDGVCHEYLSQIGVDSILCPHPFPIYSGQFNGEYEYDVSFVGAAHKYGRVEFLKKISQLYPNSYISGLHGEIITREDMLEVFRKSKINLNLTGISSFFKGGFNLPYMNKRRGFKGRPFEIGSVGGFCLSEFSPSLSKFLSDKENIVYFKDIDEAVKLIDYYLRNESERLEIAKKLSADVLIKYNDSSVENVLLKNINLSYERWMHGGRKCPGFGEEDVFVKSLEVTRFKYLVRNGEIKKILRAYFAFAECNLILFMQLHIELIISFCRKILKIGVGR